MILPILQLPDPRLIAVCEEVSGIGGLLPPAPGFVSLINDMRETMLQAKALGLAAPQVGYTSRIIVLSVKLTGSPHFAMINPVVVEKSERTEKGVEECLSSPGARMMITRPHSVRVKFWNRDGDLRFYDAHGLPARVIQHEIDHLNGVILGHRWKSAAEIAASGEKQRGEIS